MKKFVTVTKVSVKFFENEKHLIFYKIYLSNINIIQFIHIHTIVIKIFCRALIINIGD